MDIMSLTRKEILTIAYPELLFGKESLKDDYRKLMQRWHPDKPAGDKDVSHHINELKASAIKKLDLGTWDIPGFLQISDVNDRKFNIRYAQKHPFELGDMYISNTVIAYFVNKRFKKFFDNAVNSINLINIPSAKIRNKMKHSLPEIVNVIETKTHHILIVKKNKNLILLRDLIDHLGGSVDPKHSAWIVGTLYNLTCLFEYLGIVSGGLNIDNYFVSPDDHGGALLGGWWYVTQTGHKLIGLPTDINNVVPRKIKLAKLSSPIIDLESVKLVGRYLLGDSRGIKFKETAPDAMSNWLRCPASKASAQNEYSIWDDVLKCFGKRKFIIMDVNPETIYKPLKGR